MVQLKNENRVYLFILSFFRCWEDLNHQSVFDYEITAPSLLYTHTVYVCLAGWLAAFILKARLAVSDLPYFIFGAASFFLAFFLFYIFYSVSLLLATLHVYIYSSHCFFFPPPSSSSSCLLFWYLWNLKFVPLESNFQNPSLFFLSSFSSHTNFKF